MIKTVRPLSKINDEIQGLKHFFYRHGDSLTDEQFKSLDARCKALEQEKADTIAYIKTLAG